LGDFLIRYVSDDQITLDNAVGLSRDKPYPQIVFIRTIQIFVDQIMESQNGIVRRHDKN